MCPTKPFTEALPKGRKLRARCYTVNEVKRILAHTKGSEQVFFWLAAETGLRAGELIALRVSDVDVEQLSIEVSKAIWNGIEDNPKTEAGYRCVCISARLASRLKEYLAGRTDGYLFQTSTGNPWDACNVLQRNLNPLLDRLEIPKIDLHYSPESSGKKRTLSSQREARSVQHLWACTLSVTRTLLQWTLWQFLSRFENSVSDIPGTV